MISRAAVFVLALFPAVALAHGAGVATGGWAAGLLHPVTGLDHLLAMFAVGMLGARLGGRALWLLPLLFVGLLLAGAGLAFNGILLPFLEQGILLSVVLFGILVAMPRVSVALGTALVAVFALYHGVAHGAEMPLAASGFAYLAGMAISTAMLHGAGILSVARLQESLARIGGLAIAAGGLVLGMV